MLHLLPDRFLPPPIAIKNDSGKIVLDEEPDNRSEYAGLFLSLKLGLLRPEAPYDYCAPSARNKLASRTCPVCTRSFPSAASMLRHRRALHFRSRARLPEDWQQQVESASQDVVRVIDERNSEFLCVLHDGSLEWQALGSDDYRVKKFRQARSEEQDTSVNIISAEQWAQGLLIE